MNVHHLELFYYVAKHGGISAAARKMPYGIQQPAISEQLIQLEEHLGTTLFQRRPFQLTSQGAELFAFIEPFFGGLDDAENRLRRAGFQRLRIGAGKTVLKHHLPGLLATLRDKYPGLSLKLREAVEPALFAELQAGELDLIITALQRTSEPGVTIDPLLEVPLALAVPTRLKLPPPETLFAIDRVAEPLVSLGAEDTVARMFQQGLQERKCVWSPAIEVSTVELVLEYVANGFGIGLTVDAPGLRPPKGVRFVPLPDFPRVRFGVAWKNRLSPVAEALRALLRTRAEELRRALADG